MAPRHTQGGSVIKCWLTNQYCVVCEWWDGLHHTHQAYLHHISGAFKTLSSQTSRVIKWSLARKYQRFLLQLRLVCFSFICLHIKSRWTIIFVTHDVCCVLSVTVFSFLLTLAHRAHIFFPCRHRLQWSPEQKSFFTPPQFFLFTLFSAFHLNIGNVTTWK